MSRVRKEEKKKSEVKEKNIKMCRDGAYLKYFSFLEHILMVDRPARACVRATELSLTSDMEPVSKPQTVPIIAPSAVVNCSFIACHFVQPDWRRMAKSPISCGTSCNKMVKTIMYACHSDPASQTAPMARPSVKLCAKSAARFK